MLAQREAVTRVFLSITFAPYCMTNVMLRNTRVKRILIPGQRAGRHVNHACSERSGDPLTPQQRGAGSDLFTHLWRNRRRTLGDELAGSEGNRLRTLAHEQARSEGGGSPPIRLGPEKTILWARSFEGNSFFKIDLKWVPVDWSIRQRTTDAVSRDAGIGGA